MKQRLLFTSLAAVLVLAALELGSWVLLCLHAGALRTWNDLRDEQAARLDNDPVTAPERPKDWNAHRMPARPPALHPFIGFVLDPTTHWATEDDRFSRQAGEYGFPLNELDLFREPAEDEIVIAFFGGSFAANFAAELRTNAEAKAEIERLSGRRPALYSFASGGYKQPQQLTALAYFLALGVHVDVVVNLDGFNDVALAPATNIPKGYSPYYPRGWSLMVGDLDPLQRRRVGEVAYLRQRRADWAGLFARPPLAYSMTAALVWTIVDGRLSARLSRAETALESGPSESGDYQSRGPLPAYASDQAMYEDLVAFWRRSSLLMDGACRRAGARYVHFLQPNQYVPGAKPLSAQELREAVDPSHPYKEAVEKAYPLLVAAGAELRREGVDFVDLSQVYAGDPRTYYQDTCCHVNRAGNKVVARALVEAVFGAGGGSPP